MHPTAVESVGLRSHSLYRFLDFFHGPKVCEEYILEARADGPLCQEVVGDGIYLDHGGHVIKLRSPGQIFERVEVERGVDAAEFYVVHHARIPHDFHHARPRTMEVRPERRLSLFEKLPQLVLS